MVSIKSGILAGVVATFVASAMLLINNAIGKIPELHIAQTLSGMLGQPDHIMVGGITFFLIGAFLFSIIYAVIQSRIPVQSNLVKGLLFGVVIWLGMMLLYMPLAGAGLFAVNRGAIAAAAALVLTLVYGMILAAFYAWDVTAGGPPAKSSDRQPKGHHNAAL